MNDFVAGVDVGVLAFGLVLLCVGAVRSVVGLYRWQMVHAEAGASPISVGAQQRQLRDLQAAYYAATYPVQQFVIRRQMQAIADSMPGEVPADIAAFFAGAECRERE